MDTLLDQRPAAAAARALPVVHISTMGNLGNQMIQYAAAHALAALVGAVRFSNVNLPHFGILHRVIGGDFARSEMVTAHSIPLARLAADLTEGRLDRVDLRTYAQRMENLPSAAAAGLLFPRCVPIPETAGPDEVLCNVRQGDILDGHHPDYVLIPPDYYAEIVAQTGLAPVFMGQLEDSPYMRVLRRRFPKARFLPSLGAAVDFERIRAARFIVPCISTFSWLAAWLSRAERIYLPVLGLLNPAQNRGVNLLPLEDERYRFTQFPIHYGCDVSLHAEAHAALRGLWRTMPAHALAGLLGRTPPARDKALYLEAFDESFYRAVHPDIAAAVADGHLPSGLHHYATCGFDEGRAGFALDRGWYCRTYPIAALEIAQGDYWDADHHFLAAGRWRGYRRAAAETVRTKKALGGPCRSPQPPRFQ